MSEFNLDLERRDVIVVEPHPDDAFIGLWGLFHEDVFSKMHLITLTRGEIDPETGRRSDARARQRTYETSQFLQRYSVPHQYQFNLGDGEMRFIDAYEAIQPVVNTVKDPIIFVTGRCDTHDDHYTAYLAALKTEADIVEYAIDTPIASAYWASYNVPNAEKKISEFMEIYPSQFQDLTENHEAFNHRMVREYIGTQFARSREGVR